LARYRLTITVDPEHHVEVASFVRVFFLNENSEKKKFYKKKTENEMKTGEGEREMFIRRRKKSDNSWLNERSCLYDKKKRKGKTKVRL